MTTSGVAHRLGRILAPASGRAVVVPVDDSLIAGPRAGLEHLDARLADIASAGADAILGFPGHFERHVPAIQPLGWICNVTASTVRTSHTRKVQVLSVLDAMALGADAVAAHVNVTSKFEPEMLEILGRVCADGRRYGVPVVAIMYPRRELDDGRDSNYESQRVAGDPQYTELVSHCVRIASDLGASVVKTQYTGGKESFARVVEAASPLPVWIAGGVVLPPADMFAMARDAMDAGARGISFGRNVYSRPSIDKVISALRAVVHDGATPGDALALYGSGSNPE